MLDAVRLPLAALYRSLVALEDAGLGLKAMGDLAAQGGWQMIRVSAAGRLLDAGAPALELLRRFFPGDAIGRGQRLPGALAGWLTQSRSWGLDRPSLRIGQQFTVGRHGARLQIHVVPDPVDEGAAYLLMKAQRQAASAGELAALPLSEREREVLAFVAGGKTNAEIATILEISPRTVQKHLEHIFEKLGVETRTAAAVCALTAAEAATAGAA